MTASRREAPGSGAAAASARPGTAFRRAPAFPRAARPRRCQNRAMLRMGVIVLGVTDRDRAVAFWSAALGYEVRTGGFGGWATTLMPPEGQPGTPIALQLSETPPEDHPRLHLDLHVGSLAEQTAEARRLTGLGARRVDWDSYPEDPDFVVLADPDGNRFCIVDLGHVAA
jgi:catechol 2,3-dioxygenase-like lactoylglutathione lyase family enzyme